jgi:hypothetical protein
MRSPAVATRPHLAKFDSEPCPVGITVAVPGLDLIEIEHWSVCGFRVQLLDAGEVYAPPTPSLLLQIQTARERTHGRE